MEVHAHSHTARKKWTHYFWEFFMLFLAITAGFFVENQREHYIEGKREKKYIQSIAEDLRSDTAFISRFLVDQRKSIQAYDSVILLLNLDNRTEKQRQRIYYFQRRGIYLSSPIQAYENAYEQMKNSGNLRLIKTQEIADSITGYYFFVNGLRYINDLMIRRQQAVTEFEGKIFDGNVFRRMIDNDTLNFRLPADDPELMTNDKQIMNDFIVRVHYLQSIMIFSVGNAKMQKARASALLHFLNKEYHLK